MSDFDQPVVGCIHPKRMLDWSKADLSAAADIDQFLYQEFVGGWEADVNGQALVENGFAEATHFGPHTFAGNYLDCLRATGAA